ncbi:MAG: zinc ribbon domain-containing protein [Candidatus Cloacimonadota bacterium]|nr:MAG: zinc ribbon domain-containing protein [Candidatus Cloacimonadota bacterium]
MRCQNDKGVKMPVYDFKCKKCGKVIEFFLQKSDESIECPHCGSKKLVKLLSVPASIRMGDSATKGTTCCGRDERCDTPPCSETGTCGRDNR